MDHGILERLVKKYFKKLGQLLSSIASDFDQEAIHQFRVQVKKLRALLRLAATATDDPDDLKLPKKLKSLYLAAGNLRDLQLYSETISNACMDSRLPVEYIQLLQDEMNNCRKELRLMMEDDPLIKAESCIIDNLTANVSGDQIREFIQQKAAITNIFLSAPQYTDEDLHTVRKHVKDMLYVVKAAREDEVLAAELSFLPQSEMDKAELLAEELGQFVDKCIAIGFVKPSWLNEINVTERKQLRELRQHWNNELTLIKEKLHNNASALLFNIATAQ